MDFIYTASVMKSALIAGPGSKSETRLKQYRFGYDRVQVSNHIHRNRMVIPTMLKFVLFGPFYSKIGLDWSITVVRETKKNIHMHIGSNTTLALLFTIEGLCPVNFVTNNNKQKQQRQICACGKVYFKIISHP